MVKKEEKEKINIKSAIRVIIDWIITIAILVGSISLFINRHIIWGILLIPVFLYILLGTIIYTADVFNLSEEIKSW